MIEALGGGMVAATETRRRAWRPSRRNANRSSRECHDRIDHHSGKRAALPAEPFRARHLIDGAWVDSADGATSERQSPRMA
jgi:hypothetical protein